MTVLTQGPLKKTENRREIGLGGWTDGRDVTVLYGPFIHHSGADTKRRFKKFWPDAYDSAYCLKRL